MTRKVRPFPTGRGEGVPHQRKGSLTRHFRHFIETGGTSCFLVLRDPDYLSSSVAIRGPGRKGRISGRGLPTRSPWGYPHHILYLRDWGSGSVVPGLGWETETLSVRRRTRGRKTEVFQYTSYRIANFRVWDLVLMDPSLESTRWIIDTLELDQLTRHGGKGVYILPLTSFNWWNFAWTLLITSITYTS